MIENRLKNPNYIDLEPYKEKIIEDYKNGMSCRTISAQYSCDKNGLKILRCLNRWGISTTTNNSAHARGKNNPNWKGYQDIPSTFIKDYRYHCTRDKYKKRNICFDISLKEIWEIYIKQNKKCIFSGEDLKFDSFSAAHDGNISLDRIDSSKGYTKENCQLITKKINIAKADMSNKELIEIAKKITKYNERNTERLDSESSGEERISIG